MRTIELARPTRMAGATVASDRPTNIACRHVFTDTACLSAERECSKRIEDAVTATTLLSSPKPGPNSDACAGRVVA